MLSLVILITALFLSGCYDDEFTDEDLLANSSHAELSIILNDATETNADLSGFAVSIVSEGKRLTDTTDAGGVAGFSQVKLGSVPVTIEQEGYISVKGTYQFDSVENAERSQQTISVPVLPSEGENMATISGSLKADTDLTVSAVAEVPEGIEVFEAMPIGISLPPGLEYEGISFTAVSEGGFYALEVPSQSGGLDYAINPKSFVLSQQLAVNRLGDEPPFPETEPKIIETETEFGFATTSAVPSVPDVYAVVDEAPSGDNHAVLEVDGLNAAGGITSVAITDGGGGYPANDNLPVRVEGLTRGSGAEITADTDADGSVVAITIDEAGNNYSPENVNVNAATPMTGLTSLITVHPGNEHTRNITYGTGAYRNADVN